MAQQLCVCPDGDVESGCCGQKRERLLVLQLVMFDEPHAAEKKGGQAAREVLDGGEDGREREDCDGKLQQEQQAGSGK